MVYLGLTLLGLAVGCIGTLVGAGGGFILVPILVLLYPHESPDTITSISLAVVCANSISGTIGYLRRRRCDVRSGLLFSAAAVPGAILGAVTSGYISRIIFELTLGIVLIAAAVFLLFARRPPTADASQDHHTAESWLGPWIQHHRPLGLTLAFLVGFLSSLLGIGGGIVHVPALVYGLGFPVHVATATSHLVLATTSSAATAVHVATGAFAVGLRRAAALAIGAAIGAQLGVRLAPYAPPVFILRTLAVALVLVGARIIAHATLF